MDWEKWLRAAAEPPSNNENSKRERTEREIRDALAAYEPLSGRPYVVYTKGSYANNTNVRLNYDVDIAVEYRGFFYYDLMFDLVDATADDVGVEPTKDTYTRADFKRDIKAALVDAYGETSVESGRIAYRVRESKTTLPADVVPCWEYRRYDKLSNGVPSFHEGSRVYPSGGAHKNNFPRIQVTEGTAKNNETGYRYKRMVRALKKLQTRMVDDGDVHEELPSYLTECLVYNVDSGWFGNDDYLQDMRAVLAVIHDAMLEGGESRDWVEVHGLRYLFRGGRIKPTSDVLAMASAAWDKLGLE